MSCHGVKDDDGQLYFAATDTVRDALEVTAVPAAFLNEQMERCRARSIVLLLDCCYAGAFAAGAKGDGGVHLKEKFEGHGRAILTASNAIEYSWEGKQLSGEPQPSVFTAATVEGLATGGGEHRRLRLAGELLALPGVLDGIGSRQDGAPVALELLLQVHAAVA